MEGHKGLAGAGGQDDAAQALGLIPGGEGFHLVVVGLAAVVQGEVQRLPTRHQVADDVGLAPRREGGVVIGFAAPPGFDPLEGGVHGCVLVQVIEDEGAALEVQ